MTDMRKALAAPQAEPVGKVLGEGEMIGYDRRGGDVIWWNKPPGPAMLYATPPAPQASPATPVVPLQGGMDNNELLAAWQKKLPGRVPEGQELNAFAVGIEVGFEHAQRLERIDWDRVHHVLAKHGKHPGRTDDHLADVIDAALSATPVVREPLSDEQVAAGIEAWFTTEIAGKNQPFEGRMRAAYAAINGITGGSK